MTPREINETTRRMLEATQPARDAQAAIDSLGVDRANLLHTPLLRADAARRAAESAAALGKVGVPQSLLDSLARANRPQVDAVSKALANIASRTRVDVPPSLLESLARSAQPQLGAARAAALAQQASTLTQPAFRMPPSLLESLRDTSPEADDEPVVVERSDHVASLTERFKLTDLSDFKLQPVTPPWASELIELLRSQAEAGQARATQVVEFLGTITTALDSANTKAEAADARAREAEARELAEKQRHEQREAEGDKRDRFMVKLTAASASFAFLAIVVAIMVAVLSG